MSTKKAPTKAEQTKLDAEKAEAKAEEEAQTKADADADADAKAEKAEQTKLDAEKVEAKAKAMPAALKPWNGEPLMPAPESETVETAKAAPIKPAKTSGKTYHAQWTLHHNNKRYAAGDTLTLSDDDAEDLVDAGVLVATK